MRSHKDYTIGWICALPLERTAAKAILDETHAELPNPHTDNNTYTLGRIHGHNVVIACLPAGVYGTTSATAVISHLRSTFPNVRYGLMVGIGGGVPSNDNDIRLGDVVVSHPSGTVGGVVQYDLGKTVSGGDSQRTGMLNQPHTILLTAIARLRSDRMMENSSKISETVVRILDKHLDMRSEFSKPDELYDRLFLPAYDHPDLEKTCAGCDLKQLIQRKPRTSTEPQVHYGVIASGNQVIKDGQSRDRIAKETNALCFEMEAAGIMNHLPCLVVRGICDYCDSHKNKGWQGYAALTAAAFSKELLSVVPVSVTGEINRGILETKEAKDCLRDLFLTDPVEDKNALKRRKGDRASGTCSWMLDTIELKTWLGDIQQSSNDPGILWLHGLPGTGKSTMAITLVEELSKTPSFASGQKLLAYFFCESSSGNRTTVTGVLRGILYHLVIQRPELLRFILPKYNDRKATLFSSFDSLWGVLMDIVNDPATGTKYIIIDALDECDTESQKTLLKQFRQSFRDSTSGYSAPHVRILVTSRPYQEIREDLEQFNNKDLGSFDKSKRDVELFISERVAQFRARKKYTKKIADEVTRILKEKAGGTFLWIGIACDELDEKQSKDAIRYLQGLPSGLYSLYQRLLDRCVQSNPDEAKIKRLLSVIAVSRRPLSVSELSLVCELYIDEEEEERLIFTRDEIHSCRLLVVIQDDQVQLLHKSTKDFLHRHFISETKAHAMLAYRCVDRLIQYADANLKVNYGDVMKDSFLRYSVFFWMEHVRLAMTDFAVVPSQVDFFSVNSKGMESWLELYRRSSRKPVPQEGTIFHVAAAWNILPLIHHAIPMKGHDRQTKIYHDNVFKDKSGRTPLEIAAFFGHTDILSALLERLNENAVINEEVVIAAAQSRGSKEPMKLLLEQRGDQIPITEEVVKAAVSNSAHGKDIITFLLEQRGDQILVTEEMIKAAVSNAICGKEIMMFLFEQRGDQIPITEEVVKAAVRTKEDGPSVVNNNRDIEIIAFLIEQRGDQILITEEIVKDALRNPGAMAVLLEKRGDQIFITEKLFKAVLRTSGFMGVPPEQRGDLIPTIEETEETWSWYASEGIEIMEMLLGRGFIDNFITPDLVKLAIRFCPVELVKLLLHKLGKYFSITTEVMVAATRNEWHNEEMLALLLAHQLDPNFVIEDVLEEATYHKHNALHMMALLLDQANGQIAIAEQLVVAIATNGWESRNQLMLLLLTERYNYDLVLVTPAKVVELGARFFNAEVMTLLLDRLGGRVIITENLLMAVEQNKNGGDELKKILVSLTDQRREHNNNLSVTFLPSFYVSHVLHDHSDEVWVSEFSHSGNQLATGSMDGSIIIYDTLSFTIIHLLCAHGEHKPNEWVIAISWSPDDKRLVSCYWNGTIRMWNVITGDLEFHCYHRKATAAIFSIDGKTFISSSENRSQLHQWSDSGELLYSWPEDFPAVAWSLTPDGTQLITGDYSRRRIHVYDFQNHEKKLSLEFRERLTCVTVSDDARFGDLLVRLSDIDVDAVKRWHADACAVQACKDEIIAELFDSINALKHELEQKKEEVEDQKRLVASHREDNKTHMHMLKILQCKQDKLSYVSVLVDGDGMNFHEKFIQHGQNGGYEAARLLIKAAEDHIENLGTQVPPNIPYKIRVYANVEGLTKAYRDASILHGNENLTTFLQAFNKANTLCDFVDAGNGKECADVKLKAYFEQDIVDVHCVRVVFCASADNGWARVLGPHRGSKRITLVKGPPFAREMEELAADFETTSFESVFMSHKLKSRRVSFSGTSTYITPPRTPTPDYASAAKKSPPIQSSPLVLSPTTPNGGKIKLQVFTNAKGQRVDSLVHYSSRENVEELKRQKLCNQFHLLGSCTFNDCTHKHGPALSSQKTVDLTYIARLSVCSNGISCDNVRCTAGHHCPNMKCSGVNCRFPANMHGVDTAIVDPPS